MTNKEEIFEMIQSHPEGLDDDDISAMTGIKSRQQVQQLCNQLASTSRIRRHSVDKVGKRRKIHNFPVEPAGTPQSFELNETGSRNWRRRLAALVAATGRPETDLLEEALRLLALNVLRAAD